MVGVTKKTQIIQINIQHKAYYSITWSHIKLITNAMERLNRQKHCHLELRAAIIGQHLGGLSNDDMTIDTRKHIYIALVTPAMISNTFSQHEEVDGLALEYGAGLVAQDLER